MCTHVYTVFVLWAIMCYKLQNSCEILLLQYHSHVSSVSHWDNCYCTKPHTTHSSPRLSTGHYTYVHALMMPLSTYTLGQAWGVNEGTRYIVSRNASTDEVKPALQSQQIHLQNNCGFVGRLINSLPVCVGDGDRYWWCLFDQEMTQLEPNNSAYKLYLHTSILVLHAPVLGMDGGEDYPLISSRRIGTGALDYTPTGWMAVSGGRPFTHWFPERIICVPSWDVSEDVGQQWQWEKETWKLPNVVSYNWFIHKWTRWHPILLYTSYIWVGHVSSSIQRRRAWLHSWNV